MDFLNQIWNTWNEHWAANVAAILSIIAIIMTAGDKIHRLTSGIARWKGWAIVLRWYRHGQRKYRIRKAKNIMHSKIAQTSVRIQIRTYTSCLAEDQRTSDRNSLSAITPKKPSWLNDYYVASALEALSRECKIVKANGFSVNGFPPSPEWYLFLNRKAGTTPKQQADVIETDGKCLVHQSFQQCLEAPRYEIGGYAETTAPGTTQFFTQSRLRDDAPPCSRCWDIETRWNNIRLLVNSITSHDLAPTATIDITGINQEFQEAIIATCMESKLAAEVANVKKVVEQAIEIRSNQIAKVPEGKEGEWTDQSTEEFKSILNASISAELESNSP